VSEVPLYSGPLGGRVVSYERGTFFGGLRRSGSLCCERGAHVPWSGERVVSGPPRGEGRFDMNEVHMYGGPRGGVFPDERGTPVWWFQEGGAFFHERGNHDLWSLWGAFFL
jgi:hypothetical protein